MLSKVLPTDQELHLVNKICVDLGRDNPSWESFTKDVREFMKRNELKGIPSYGFTRLRQTGKGLTYIQKVAVFDFLVTDYLGRLTRRQDRQSKDHAQLITAAKESYAAKRPSPLSFLAENEESRPTASSVEPFLGAYVGYRVSSHQGQVVRFSLCIEQSVEGEIMYRNVYDRDEVRWICSGGGLLHDKSLYLIGKAVDQRNPRLHRGYRMLCLVPWRGRILHGVVISRDGLGPIAARFVAIPVDLHALSPSPGRYGGLVERHRKVLEGNDWDAANALIEIDREFLQRGDGAYDELQRIIEEQTLDAIEAEESREEELSIWNFIVNVTGTTLHGYLKKPHVDVLGEAPGMDAKFDAMVDRLVRLMMTSRAPMRDMIYEQLSKLAYRDLPAG